MAALTIWKDGEPSSLEVDPGTLLSDALIAAGAAPDINRARVPYSAAGSTGLHRWASMPAARVWSMSSP